MATLRRHWPEYLMEGAELGIFMISACAFTTLLHHPASPVVRALPDPTLRRVLTGIAMGLTAVGIIYSPWGQRSGAHFNPSLTLTYLHLRKVAPVDALFYVLAQFVGAVAGVLLAAAVLGERLAHATVNYAVTMPGPYGVPAAFVAEFAISLCLMSVVLTVSNRPRLARLTPLFAATLVAIYISVEAPLSGMSMNPARTLGSAFPAHAWSSLWVYFTAPPLGMLAAAELYRRRHKARAVLCAKLNHHNTQRCIFRCGYVTQP